MFAPGPEGISVLVVPTAPTHWTVSEVLSDPIKTNSLLGAFTHSGNVLDLTAVAVPAGSYLMDSAGDESVEDDSVSLPFGITLLGVSRSDATILEIGRRLEEGKK